MTEAQREIYDGWIEMVRKYDAQIALFRDETAIFRENGQNVTPAIVQQIERQKAELERLIALHADD